MSLSERIILIASVITALTVIVTFAVTCYKFIRKEEKWRETKDRHDKENYLNILRLVIMSDEMPLTERIAAGDKYIALGGNGAIKHKYQELIAQLKEE
ncbi:MAG: hypothetical protein J1F23_08480 [Oscillospiraceae bacterium]|nr:hypothetical protein [Oscillospiraceae bacterium]